MIAAEADEGYNMRNHAREFFWKALQRTGLVKRRKHHFQVTIDAFKERLDKFPVKAAEAKAGLRPGGAMWAF